jgi:hypothetical protein
VNKSVVRVPRFNTSECGVERFARAGKSRGASDTIGDAPSESVMFAEKFTTTCNIQLRFRGEMNVVC